jgi:hypothetical protein
MPLSPEQARTWDELRDVILEELTAQIAIGRLENPDGKRATANLITDMIWRRFEVRER